MSSRRPTKWTSRSPTPALSVPTCSPSASTPLRIRVTSADISVDVLVELEQVVAHLRQDLDRLRDHA